MIERVNLGGVDFPYPNKKYKKHITIRMSGGIDSALLLYSLAWIKKQGLMHPENTFQPITGINHTRPYQHVFVNQVVDYVNKRFDMDIPYTISETSGEHRLLENVVTDLSRNNHHDMSYSGQSKFLPLEEVSKYPHAYEVIQGKYFPGHRDKTYLDLVDVVNHSDTDHERAWEAGIKEEEILGIYVRPFINLNKIHTKMISDYFDITDDILRITRSCERENFDGTVMTDFSHHCGECVWCAERYITFGKLQ